MELWYAVNRTGQGRIFTSRPVRSNPSGLWEGDGIGWATMAVIRMEEEGFELPDLSYDDEPVKLRLILQYG